MQTEDRIERENPVADAAKEGTSGRPSWMATVGLWAALAALVLGTGVVCKTAFAVRKTVAHTGIPAPGSSVGTVMDNALPATIADLPLVDQDGSSTSLSAFAGKTLMISDTMTLCQETCPLDTEDLVQTARTLDADGFGANVEFLTITIDPARDTPAQLAAYRDLYTPVPSNWQALTGSASAISALWRYFGVYVRRVPEGTPASVNWRTGQKLTYDLNHSDEIFFIDEKGTERYLLEGMGHIAPGTSVPQTMLKYLDAAGLANLKAPASDGWTVPQGLGVLAWLLQRPIPAASAGTS